MTASLADWKGVPAPTTRFPRAHAREMAFSATGVRNAISTMPSPDFNVKDSKSSLGIERRFDRHDTAETIDVTMIHEMIHEQKRQSKLKENLMSYPVAIPASEIFNGNVRQTKCGRIDENSSCNRFSTKFCSRSFINHYWNSKRSYENAFDEYFEPTSRYKTRKTTSIGLFQ